jgi:hypothetical protein
MTVTIGRRELLAALGGAAAAWPLTARAQQTAKPPTVGVLGPGTPSSYGQWVATFVRRLHELGWIEGRTVTIEYRWAEGRTEGAADIAAEFIQRRVDVIVTSGTSTVLAAKQATSVIPIVFAAIGDPVGGCDVVSEGVAERAHLTYYVVPRVCGYLGRRPGALEGLMPPLCVLARIMHYAALFCTSGELTRAEVPSGEIGVRQLVMQRVRG